MAYIYWLFLIMLYYGRSNKVHTKKCKTRINQQFYKENEILLQSIRDPCM
uniref:Uncharacterized protein n=1 Tax=Rhizophora mucronata TaxID=61149 RepID=A0A2P2QIW2_RHIMU